MRKLLSLTAILAIIIGVVDALFLAALHWAGNWHTTHAWLLWGLPFIAVLTTFIYTTYGKGASEGNNRLINYIHNAKEVPIRMGPLTFIFTLLTHLFGGSAGREGSAVQMGGSIAYALAKRFNLTEVQGKILVQAGISAGFAGLFGTPIAGTVFGLEMPYINYRNWSALMPCFIAAFLSHATALLFGAKHTTYNVILLDQINLTTIGELLVSSILFASCGLLFTYACRFAKHFSLFEMANPYLQSGFKALIYVLIIFLISGEAYKGLSLDLMDKAFQGQVHWYDSWLKLGLTSLTLGAGLQGGEVTPLFVIGASLGSFFAILVGSSPSFYAALGLMSVFASATRSPLTSIFLSIDLFGWQLLPYTTLTLGLAYLLFPDKSIYGAQRKIS